MQLAENKRQNNISEYIIYMYQAEDLIRVYNFNLEDIKQYVIKHLPVKEEERGGITQWYADIARQMKKEGIEDRGHLASTQKIVEELESIKNGLLNKDKEFTEIYEKAKPHIESSLQEAYGLVKGEIQACLNGIYGLLLARMNGHEVPKEITEQLNFFGNVLSYLSYKYKQKNFMNNN